MIGEADQAARRQDIHVGAGPGRFGPLSAGQISPLPMALAPIAAGSAPATGAIVPSRLSSPIDDIVRERIGGNGAERGHQASAIGRS